MSDVHKQPPLKPSAPLSLGIRRQGDSLFLNPVAAYLLLSTIFGSAIIAIAPPLRGPAETAHFLRAYGIGQGDFVPSMEDGDGHKGVPTPWVLLSGIYVFESWQVANRGSQFSYSRVFEEYFERKRDLELSDEVFVPYAGSEGYSPAAYFPAGMALLARVSGLGFLSTFYLMRIAGFAAMTAVVTYAIATAPVLKWTFFAIAMLPAAFYGRAVINADGGAFAYSLVLVAMFLRVSVNVYDLAPSTFSVWNALSALSKPPNLAFALLGWMRPVSEGTAKWRNRAIAILPAIVSTAIWTAASSADVAAWRLVEFTGVSPVEFGPAWKLRFMLHNPQHFLSATFGIFRNKDIVEFWHQVVGILGLFDTVLRSWIYTLISWLLAGTFLTSLGTTPRLFPAVMAFIVALGYCFAILLIFYLVWTPVYADEVWGIQGRYFVPILPLIAVMLAAVLNCGLDARVTALFAVSLGMLAGAGLIDAILRADWNF